AVIGFARSLAKEVGPMGIRVNVIAPGTVDTDMVQNDGIRKLFRPDLEAPTKADVAPMFAQMSILGIPWVESIDVSNALVFLSSEDARYITGVVLPVDAGMAAN
ncbi:MAG TPA: SDR family oxidoreductase, partial [Ilumatobacter sp.]|nr:SDR family oxidoreductase [Ilumatobacter sp.]